MKNRYDFFLIAALSLFFMLFTFACSTDATVYEKADSFKGVQIKMKINKVTKKELMGEKYSFVYFDYTVDNQHPEKLFFHPGKIKVIYNGLQNDSVEYDSMASAMTEAVVLTKGIAAYKLYLVFKQPDVNDKIRDLEILHTGIGLNDGGS